jgi:transcriptional regulator with GAF, ATPase, and Fis domain
VTDDERQAEILAQAAWAGVSTAFAALGRTFICVDERFHVLHASRTLDELLGEGASKEAEGRPIEEMLGGELFGPSGTLRLALLAGERREGWCAHLRLEASEHKLVSLSAAPLPKHADSLCDERVAHVIVLRPADEYRAADLGSPTAVSGLMVRSHAMTRILGLIEQISQSEATVLITGESGTGKEVVARAIHEHSPRRDGPFVAVNCGALPADLLESEMFGHVRGAFTGAIRDRVGRFDLASAGTLFLDEVGDLPLPLQVKLLRVLQGGIFERVGESASRQSHARIMAATHIDLAGAVREGRFRSDLYYRLRVIPIEIPPLRQRREDIEPIAQVLLARVGARHGRALRFSPDALRILLGHDWPGNVRELENVIEYAVAVCRGQTILPEDLAKLSTVSPSQPVLVPPGSPLSAPPTTADSAEAKDLRQILVAHNWKRATAAQALGISRSTLWRRMRQAGLI